MSKRSGSFTENVGKKFKTVHDLNDLWGDELDVADVEDCFMLASQALDQNYDCTQRNNVSILAPNNELEIEESFVYTQKNNVSILPSYNAFQQDQSTAFTSTQTNSSAVLPSTSNWKAASTNNVQNLVSSSQQEFFNQANRVNNYRSGFALQNELQKLQEQLEAKEGETSILRSQLRQIRVNMEAEHARKEQTWTEKLNVTLKEMNAVKSELEFKNLEIANLKKKVIEVTKYFNAETSFSANQSVKGEEKTTSTLRNKSEVYADAYEIEAVVEYGTLLSPAISSSVFNVSKSEPYQTNLKYNSGYKSDRFLQKEDHIEIAQLKKINEGKNFKLDCIYVDVSVLMKCNAFEIKSEIYYLNINRVVCVSTYVLQKFHEYLVVLESNMQNEDIEQLDNLYLKKGDCVNMTLNVFDPKEWCPNEIGIKARQTVAVISEILQHSKYLRSHLLENKLLIYNEKQDDLPKPNLNGERNEFDFLHLVLSVISVIGRIRKAENCVGFLCAIVTLLMGICVTPEFNNCYFLVLSIAKEIVFTRPPGEVIKFLSNFFKRVSLNPNFVQDLCKMPAQRSLKVNSKEGTLIFNKESCVLQVFTALFEDSFINSTVSRDLDVNLNMLKFVTNLFNANCLWLHYQETNYCDCLLKINNVSIEIIQETLKVYKRESLYKLQQTTFAGDTVKCKEILRFGIKVLYILSFKSADLIMKYSVIECQYKVIVQALLDLKEEFDLSESDLKSLEILNVQDDVPMIGHDKFDNIPCWM